MIPPPTFLAEWLRDEFRIDTPDLAAEPLDVRLLVIFKADAEAAYGDWSPEQAAAWEEVSAKVAATLTERQEESVHYFVAATRASAEDLLSELTRIVQKHNLTEKREKR